jgi:hypothetical protein
VAPAHRHWASTWYASTIRASPVSKARRLAEVLRGTVGWPLRVSALSKAGMSSWTRDAQCISSMALPMASLNPGASSPQANATAVHSCGRIRAPAGENRMPHGCRQAGRRLRANQLVEVVSERPLGTLK